MRLYAFELEFTIKGFNVCHRHCFQDYGGSNEFHR